MLCSLCFYILLLASIPMIFADLCVSTCLSIICKLFLFKDKWTTHIYESLWYLFHLGWSCVNKYRNRNSKHCCCYQHWSLLLTGWMHRVQYMIPQVARVAFSEPLFAFEGHHLWASSCVHKYRSFLKKSSKLDYVRK